MAVNGTTTVSRKAAAAVAVARLRTSITSQREITSTNQSSVNKPAPRSADLKREIASTMTRAL
jgi:hypothetical protein